MGNDIYNNKNKEILMMLKKIGGYLKTRGSIKAKLNGVYLNTFQMITKIKNCNIYPKTFIDVGANRGMMAKTVNYIFPYGMIYSFEPIKECFKELKKLDKNIDNLTAFNCALSNEKGKAIFNESTYDYSSSLLPMSKRHIDAYPYTAGNKTYEVDVDKLDNYIDKLNLLSPVFLKIDVQGAELKVLEGAKRILHSIDYIMLEISFQELYEKQPLIREIIDFMDDNSFKLFDIIYFNRDPLNNELLQMDGLFKRVNN